MAYVSSISKKIFYHNYDKFGDNYYNYEILIELYHNEYSDN